MTVVPNIFATQQAGRMPLVLIDEDFAFVQAEIDEINSWLPGGVLAIAHGGTGADTADGALTNLGGGVPTGTGPLVRQSDPALEGVPTAPTASVGTNTTQLATTAFVLANGSGGATPVADRTALAALSTSKAIAWLEEANRQGMFQWNSANLSTQVTADTQQGIYVAPASDPTGASGAWVRQYDGTAFYVEWFGCAGDGVTDDTTSFQAGVTYAGTIGAEVVLGNGKTYLLTGNINVGVGNQSVDIRGRGWQNSELLFSGASVTTGLTLTGSGWSYAGKISNLAIRGQSGALAGVTCTDLNHPIVERCIIKGFDGGYAAKFDGCLMPAFAFNLVGGCGSASLGQVIVEGVTNAGTTFMWLHSRISGDGVTGAKCGLQIDNVGDTVIIGGAIESTNTPIMVSGNTSLTGGCPGGSIRDIDLENPGNGNYYLSFGAGWTGSASGAASAWLIEKVSASGSGTTQMPGGFYINQTFGLKFNACANLPAVGTPAPTAVYVLAGTGNVQTFIDPHPTMGGYSMPWVTVNGTWQKDASPLVSYRQGSLSPPANFSGQTITGATPTTIVYSAQGGYYGELIPFNSTATTMTSLGSTGVRGQQIILISLGAGVTTLQQGTGTDQFNLTGGVNLAMTSGRPYGFVHNGTYWQQMY